MIQPLWKMVWRFLRIKPSCCCCCQVASVVSNSIRPHRRQPTRLPGPWDSPGKNTGVVCHFLLQCMKMKSESEVAQSCLTLSDPMGCSPPGSSIHGVFQAKNTGVGCHCLLRPYNPALSLLGIYPEETKIEKDMYPVVHCSTMYNS